MNTPSRLWKQLRKGSRYRGEFVAAFVKKLIPLQIRRLLKHYEMSQETLAERSGLTQGAVSRAANVDYGNLTLNTIVRIAAGFDIAFIGTFVPFTEFEQWVGKFSEDSLFIKTFEDEDKEIEIAAGAAEPIHAKEAGGQIDRLGAVELQNASNAELVPGQQYSRAIGIVRTVESERAGAEAVAKKQAIQVERGASLVGAGAAA
jgi:transcriptional regulator with XRE-family HTH domain